MEGWLIRVGWDDNIIPDQTIRAKQTLKKHAGPVCKLVHTMQAICNVILESGLKEEEPHGAAQKPTSLTLQM